MAKHTEAINVLKDELEEIVEKVKWLRSMDAGFTFAQIITNDNLHPIKEWEGLRYRKALRGQLQRGKSIMASIKVLEGDN